MDQNKREGYIKLLEESLEKVVRVLSPQAEEISVFGSYARQKSPDLFTDLDILIVQKFIPEIRL